MVGWGDQAQGEMISDGIVFRVDWLNSGELHDLKLQVNEFWEYKCFTATVGIWITDIQIMEPFKYQT